MAQNFELNSAYCLCLTVFLLILGMLTEITTNTI